MIGIVVGALVTWVVMLFIVTQKQAKDIIDLKRSALFQFKLAQELAHLCGVQIVFGEEPADKAGPDLKVVKINADTPPV